MLVALLVCLIPTTIGALLSAIGIAGMDRLVRRNVLALSGSRGRGRGRLLDAAARQDRHDHARQPPGGRVPAARRRASRRSSPTPRSSRAWPTRRRRAARSSSSPRSGSDLRERELAGATLVPFSARDPDERRRHARPLDPQGRRRTRSGAGSPSRAATETPSSPTLVDGRRARAAARRSSSPRTAARSASCT